MVQEARTIRLLVARDRMQLGTEAAIRMGAIPVASPSEVEDSQLTHLFWIPPVRKEASSLARSSAWL